MGVESSLSVVHIGREDAPQLFYGNLARTGFSPLEGLEALVPQGEQSNQELLTRLTSVATTFFQGLTPEETNSFNGALTEGQSGISNQVGENRSGKDGETVFSRRRVLLMIGREVPEGHPYEAFRKVHEGFFPATPLIPRVPELVTLAQQFLQRAEDLLLHHTEGLERVLEVLPGTFCRELAYGNTTLRLNWYPGVPSSERVSTRELRDVQVRGYTIPHIPVMAVRHGETIVHNVVRTDPHTDVGLMTTLAQARRLYILDHQGNAIEVNTTLGQMVLNTADLAEHFFTKNGKAGSLKPTMHWVGLHPDTSEKDRLSIVVFHHPQMKTVIGQRDRLLEYAAQSIYESLAARGRGYLSPERALELTRLIHDRLPTAEQTRRDICDWEKSHGINRLRRYMPN
ncbi:isopenicillin N synthase family oxygenase [Candidatus Woesearchaeota archaeon]|nr:isopenicillin N synthase family oxygenase [Candidatus Woesearchaeota archaeon]